MIRALAIALVVASASPALADDDGKRAGEEANLESTDRRQGFWMQGGLGPSVTVGGGTGTGAGGSLMIGQVMRPTWVALLAFTGNVQRHEVIDTIHQNDYTTIQAGFQWWPAGSAFWRFGAGFGAYRCKQCTDPDEPMSPVTIDYRRRGLTGGTAFGVDLVRFKGLVWGIEAGANMTVTPDGAILSLTFQSYLSLD